MRNNVDPFKLFTVSATISTIANAIKIQSINFGNSAHKCTKSRMVDIDKNMENEKYYLFHLEHMKHTIWENRKQLFGVGKPLQN